MKIGLVISTDEPELAWNAFRYGVKAIENKHSVRVFLLGRGVECEEIDDDKFDVKAMMNEFVEKGGTILACGICEFAAIFLRPSSSMTEIIATGIPTGSIQDSTDTPRDVPHAIIPDTSSANIRSRMPIIANISPKISFRFLDEWSIINSCHPDSWLNSTHSQ